MSIKRFRYRAYPTDEQQHSFQQIFGACRFVYNYMLAHKKKEYDDQKAAGIAKPKTSGEFTLSKQILTPLKKQEEYKWLNDVPAICLISANKHLDIAYKNFFRRVKQGGAPGFPKFKSKFRSQKAFSFHQGYKVDLQKQFVTVPKNGELEIVVHRHFFGDYKTCTVIQEPSGKYYVSLVVDDKLPVKPLMPLDDTRVVGIDVGVINAISFSDRHRINMNLDFIKDEKRLLRLQRNLSRKVHGKGIKASRNFSKAKLKLAKKHERIRLKRKHEIERIACALILYLKAMNYCGVALRKYDIKEMVDTDKVEKDDSGKAKKNKRFVKRKLNKKILGGAMGMICQQLKYKLTDNGFNIVEFRADETKTTERCSNCKAEGADVAIDLKTRIIECKICGHIEDIDYNASKNVLWYGLQTLENQEVEA